MWYWLLLEWGGDGEWVTLDCWAPAAVWMVWVPAPPPAAAAAAACPPPVIRGDW